MDGAEQIDGVVLAVQLPQRVLRWYRQRAATGTARQQAHAHERSASPQRTRADGGARRSARAAAGGTRRRFDPADLAVDAAVGVQLERADRPAAACRRRSVALRQELRAGRRSREQAARRRALPSYAWCTWPQTTARTWRCASMTRQNSSALARPMVSSQRLPMSTG